MRSLIMVMLGVPLCLGMGASGSAAGEGGRNREMIVSSPAFDNGGMIPGRYACDGSDISPPLAWRLVPPSTRSFALICDDPDAPMGTWVHWVLYNLPAALRELPEKVPSREKLANGAIQGINDFRRIGYGGPCPPSGTHRYYFKLYALDTRLELAPGATRAQLEQAMAGHILAEGRLMGRYRK